MNYGKTGGTLAATGAAGFLGYWYVGAGIILLTLAVLVYRNQAHRVK